MTGIGPTRHMTTRLWEVSCVRAALRADHVVAVPTIAISTPSRRDERAGHAAAC
jgi:hypothetical protein